MANRYNVKYDGRPIALAHVLPHPRYTGQLMLSVIPLHNINEPVNGTGGFRMRTALYGRCPDTKAYVEAILELLAESGFEPEKVTLKPVGRR